MKLHAAFSLFNNRREKLLGFRNWFLFKTIKWQIIKLTEKKIF
jgi:hypothetical protein